MLGNFLIANLDQAGQTPAGQRVGNVLRSRKNVLHTVATELGGEHETLRAGDQRRPIRSRQRDALIGRNDLHIDQPGKLLDEIILRVDQSAVVLALGRGEIADLLIDIGDLRGQGFTWLTDCTTF